MGGTAAAAAITTAGAIDLVNSNRRQRHAVSRQKKADFANRKNLLEQQLASKRAQLGAMGLNSSSMLIDSTAKLTKDYHSNSSSSLHGYQDKEEELNYRRNSGLLSFGNKILK